MGPTGSQADGSELGPPGAPETALAMTGVRKTYRSPDRKWVEVLGPVDLRIGEGEFVAIVGPSGCGKSTLLRIAADLVHPSGGVIERKSDKASFVFQEPGLLPWRTIGRNCELPLELAQVPKARRKERVREVLHFVHLGAWANFYPHQLSGGMKMRAALARALALDSTVVYFDEPFSATDELGRELLNEFLSKLWSDRRFAALFVTHSISEAVFLANRVLVMSDRPGRFLGEFAVPLEFPRTAPVRTSDQFVGIQREVVALLRGGTSQAASGTVGGGKDPRTDGAGPAPTGASGGGPDAEESGDALEEMRGAHG